MQRENLIIGAKEVFQQLESLNRTFGTLNVKGIMECALTVYATTKLSTSAMFGNPRGPLTPITVAYCSTEEWIMAEETFRSLPMHVKERCIESIAQLVMLGYYFLNITLDSLELDDFAISRLQFKRWIGQDMVISIDV